VSKQPTFSLDDYLQHIHEAAALILDYTKGMSKDNFLSDRKTQQAVLMNLMVLGEATALLRNEHPDFVAGHPEVEWSKIRGMRNILAHEYWAINMGIVWETAISKIPMLHGTLTDLIAGRRDNAGRLPRNSNGAG